MHHDAGRITLSLSEQDTVILSNALNEILYGVDLSEDELGPRIGAKADDIRKLHDRLKVALSEFKG